MDIHKLLKEKGLTKYRLAVLSGVPPCHPEQYMQRPGSY